MIITELSNHVCSIIGGIYPSSVFADDDLVAYALTRKSNLYMVNFDTQAYKFIGETYIYNLEAIECSPIDSSLYSFDRVFSASQKKINLSGGAGLLAHIAIVPRHPVGRI